MFRLANLRRHDLTDARCRFTVSMVPVNGQPQRRFDLLALERTSIIFMPLHWVIVHPIDERSPLRGTTRESLRLVTLNRSACSVDTTRPFAQTVHARISYDKGEIVWGARFRDIYTTDMDHVSVDLTRLSDYDEVDSPAAV